MRSTLPRLRLTRPQATVPPSRSIQNGWICARCLSQAVSTGKEAQSASTDKKKPYYVTTPIFYVNAAPHVGHLYSMLLADIIKRWQMLLGNPAILCTGTDEHGMKVQRAAAREGVDPKAFCDKGADTFKELAARLNMSNDYFIRTTDASHRKTVQYVWQALDQAGYIYKSKHEGWYSVSDETFFPANAVHVIIDPPTGRKIMATKEDQKEVEWFSEINYHFRLSAFREPLLKFYEENPDFIEPKSRMDQIVKSVTEGLQDLSISRPSERLSWGIGVPHDPSQTIYVWLDALFNYLTTAGFPWSPGEESAGGWPADCHVIGKDIIRFHCIYWPAFLMALNISPPKQVLTHAHWTLRYHKMSKSTGIGVNPFQAIERFGVDGLRYYLVHDGGIADDSNYSNEAVSERYRAHLQNKFGNFVMRVLKPVQWSVQEAVVDYKAGELKEPVSSLSHLRLQNRLRHVCYTVERRMSTHDFRGALRKIMSIFDHGNAFVQEAAPWDLAKSPDRQPLNAVIFDCAEALRIGGILMQPFIPGQAKVLLNILGVRDDRRSFEHAAYGVDDDYGTPGPPDPNAPKNSAQTRQQRRIPRLFPILPVD